eukprot:12204231-Alexandrium_andersonii.AAC.1
MSASLVGSEMCIRDRCRPGLDRRAAPPWRRGWGPVENPRNSRLGGRGPVSYTHLTLPTICSV